MPRRLFFTTRQFHGFVYFYEEQLTIIFLLPDGKHESTEPKESEKAENSGR